MSHALREWRWWFVRRSPVGGVQFGNLRRLTPISRLFGFNRGQCIDRYYIERFLAQHADDIRGDVLEIGDDAYTRRFGGNRVTRREVLHVIEENPQATLVADLSRETPIVADPFDCVICTQTLHFIYEVRKALKTFAHILKPHGTLLATFPGISQISRYDMDRWGDYWRFTTLSAQRLFEEAFPNAVITVEAYGNVLVAMAFLHGLSVQELRQEELDYVDPDYELVIVVRVVNTTRKVAP